MKTLNKTYDWMAAHPYKTVGIIASVAVLPAAGVLGYAAMTAPWYVAYIPGTILKSTIGYGTAGALMKANISGASYSSYVGSLTWAGKPAAAAAYSKAFSAALPSIPTVATTVAASAVTDVAVSVGASIATASYKAAAIKTATGVAINSLCAASAVAGTATVGKAVSVVGSVIKMKLRK